MNCVIGRKYKYPKGTKTFTVDSFCEIRGIIWFSCGHWCTDTVFEDLIDCVTGIQNCHNKQLSLF